MTAISSQGVTSVASIDETVRELNAQRLKIWERGKEILDVALRDGRTLTAEESENYDKMNDDIMRLDKTRDALLSSERAEREVQPGERRVPPGVDTARAGRP
jgi:spermidine synthase